MLLGDFGQLEGFEPTQKKIKADLRKKNSSLLFCICRKNKAVFVAYPQEEKQNQERLFLMSERRDAECGSKK